jgi:hypothetical protein
VENKNVLHQKLTVLYSPPIVLVGEVDLPGRVAWRRSPEADNAVPYLPMKAEAAAVSVLPLTLRTDFVCLAN